MYVVWEVGKEGDCMGWWVRREGQWGVPVVGQEGERIGGKGGWDGGGGVRMGRREGWG